MKQTAVEWFFMTMNIRGLLPNDEIVECYEQAKEMFEKQIIEAFIEGRYKKQTSLEKYEFAEQYYNKTFKK
jgi:hypothetical protein